MYVFNCVFMLDSRRFNAFFSVCSARAIFIGVLLYLSWLARPLKSRKKQAGGSLSSLPTPAGNICTSGNPFAFYNMSSLAIIAQVLGDVKNSTMLKGPSPGGKRGPF